MITVKNLFLSIGVIILTTANAIGQCVVPTSISNSNSCASPGVPISIWAQTVDPSCSQTISHRWYTSPTTLSYVVGTPIYHGGSCSLYQTKMDVTQTTHYWVSAVINGCESSRVKVSGIIHSNITPILHVSPSTSTTTNGFSGAIACSTAGQATVTFEASGGYSNANPSTSSVYEWYNAPSGGVLLGTGPTLTTTITAGQTINGVANFYLGGTLKNSLGCSFPISPRKAIAILLKDYPGCLNYIESYSPLQDTYLTRDAVVSGPVSEINKISNFFDGIGRPMQNVMRKGSPLGNDVVQPKVYDDFGRESRTYLPVVVQHQTGTYQPSLIDQNGVYAGAALNFFNNPNDKIADDIAPYSETLFEPNPLDRIRKTGGVGQTWQPTLAATSYSNYSQSWNYKDFLVSNVSGGGSNVSVQITNNALTVTFSAGFGSTQLKTGPVKWVASNPTLYNMELGLISLGNYKVSIKDGFLFIEATTTNPAYVTGFGLSSYGATRTFTINLTPIDRSVKLEYLLNGANEVLKWTYDNATTLVNAGTAAAPTYYPANTITIQKTIDEHGNSVLEYRDNEDRILLKRVQAGNITTPINDTNYASTYYIYDSFSKLSCVLPPEATRLLSTQYFQSGSTNSTKEAFLKLWTFRYTYDAQRRMITKQLPGADPIYLVYDNRDRLVLTQDGQQRLTNKWSYIKYDYLNRPIITGIYAAGSSIPQSIMSGLVSTTIFHETYNGVSSTHGYTSTSNYFPSSATTPLTVTYYDNYLFRSMTTGLGYVTNDYTGQPAENSAVKGLVTGTKVNVLGSSTYLYSANYYDTKYRVVQTISQNIRNATDRVSNRYDFPGRVIETVSTHNNGTTSYTTKRRMEYDHGSRLKKVYHKFSTEPEILLVENEYNELGQLVTKKQHSRNSGSTFAQYTDYRYNIRGWLEKVNDPDAPEANDLFSIQLNYNTPTANGGAAQFNGNISEMRWSSAGMDKQSYGYNYDVMNRLKEANYYNAIKPIENGRYDEKLIGPGNTSGYDLNGNIRYLTRNGKRAATPQGTFDNLTYNYVGNQLKIVNDAIADNTNEEGFKELTEKTFNLNNTDAQNEYAYDKNGNMTKDDNKGITAITYNHLNLPQQVNKGATDYVVYTYDATGRKLKQQVYGSTPKTTEYLGEFIYENNSLQYILHEDGRIVADNSPGAPRPWEYQYHLKDHLGNVRVGFSEKTTTTTNSATLENATQTTEQATFRNYGNRSALSIFNKTPGGTYSQVLNGGNNNQIGLAKSFAVNPGDVFDLEVYGKYEQPTATGNNLNNLFSALASAFTLNPTGGTGIDGQQAYNAFNGLYGGGPAITTGEWEDDNAPKAYLNYILFDQNFALVDMGWDQISYSAKQIGVSPVVAHDYMSLHVKVKQQGYLYIYLSNENPTMSNVYFDDFVIKRSTAIEQVANYYAFGLAQNSNGFERQGGAKNPLLYNGKELQDELNLGWLDYGARMYMPDLGKWAVIDPMSEFYSALSPYNYVLNNPIRLIDPNGMSVVETDSSFVFTGNDIFTIWNHITRPKTHTIEEGDTYYGLAKRTYKGAFSVDDLKKWNPNVDFTKLKAGQVINLASEEDRKLDALVRYVAKQIEAEGIDSNDPLVLQVIWQSFDGKVNPNDIQIDEAGNLQGIGIIGELSGPVVQKEAGKWLGKKMTTAGASAVATKLVVGGAKTAVGTVFSIFFMLLDPNDAGKGSSQSEQREAKARYISEALDTYLGLN